ncbi:ankyrin repeat and EF-hand domain-containing protein 1-like [Tachysurus fulvidraco]|uniref:ankyrin repeat and EF-hand domain-containing protein 1-like n=1 Tax=Tachysurus fulvidraco TaxID=1234273 RepID=UPI001FEF3273|nr:ankyrin repeat and EF-hand domain-containing protein 1-like [Tachysurus fulvidraco]XP_047677778.1 ankyrin repeat and EF-hand domain-containing protein 1-like [Tachysurus fulvidraco]
MSYMSELEKTRIMRDPSKLQMKRRNFVAENLLETKQVYKLLRLVNQKNKEQIEKLVLLGVPDLINLTEPEEGISALHLATVENDLELASFLLSLNAHPDVPDKKGRTAMMLAAERGHVDMVDFLYSNQASVSLVDLEGKGLLFYCIGPTDSHKQIMDMVLKMDVDVNNTSNTGKSVFMFACEHAEMCENFCMRLLESGADPDVADPATGCTALMAAVTAGSVALVKAILQKGVDPNKVNKNGLNSVHIAAAKGYIEMLIFLSAYSADFSITADLGHTALHAAAAAGHAECCRFLFQRGCKMTKNKQDLLPSQIAKNNGHKAALRVLKDAEQSLKTGNVAVNEAKLHDWSFEHKEELREAFQTAEEGEPPEETVPNETLVSVLQEHHAPIDEESLEEIVKALDKNRWGKINIDEFFAGHLFLPNQYPLSSYKSARLSIGRIEQAEPPSTEITPTSPESFEPSAETIRDRLQVDVTEDALLNLEPKELYINLSQCVKSDKFDLLKLAFSQNVPVDTRDRIYKTPLMTACMMGKYQMAQFLISHGADVNAYDQFKWTALHHACMEGHADIVKLLVDHGAIVNATTTNGVTPLMTAIKRSKSKCVDQLLNSGANVDVTNKHGQDCMTIAQLYGNIDICVMVQTGSENLKSQISGKKAAPAPPKSKKPAAQMPTKKSQTAVNLIGVNPNVTDYLITLPSATVQGLPVVSSPRLEPRLAERKKRFAKEDPMKLVIQ